jgi:2-polyprenyl-6-methoxyphenol hydroxylase-like FAD-dependent oxidoreductase
VGGETCDAIVVGAGIGGLVTALSLHDAGLAVQVHESVDDVRALGVGINLLPHAVRELDALGLLERLEAVAVAPTTLAYFTKRGQQIWSEPRGRAAGYRWPQLSIHRGELQQVLLAAVVERLGADRVHTRSHLVRFETDDRCARAWFASGRDVEPDPRPVVGGFLIAADGIHSAARRQLRPEQGPPRWNGSLLWRGAVAAAPVLDGRTMVWAGHPRQKFVGYPIRDLDDGRQMINFIAELRTDDGVLADREDWNRPGDLSDVLPRFAAWTFDWLDVPALLRAAPGTYLFPMVDRDPLERWSHGRMTLLGDAAHPMYPIGSNGASQAILDARTLTGCLRSFPDHVEQALVRYDEVRRPATAAIVLANRGMGPEMPMQLVEERAPDGFAEIGDVISPDEIATITEDYRRTAGFALAALTGTPSLADRDYR